ncbi:MAG: hypothetical protein ACRD0G_12290, partial [Acidimicrobiales bacterium]
MRRGVVLVTALVLASPIVAASVAASAEAQADVPVVHLDGRGHGHGVGLSQWGAHYLAEAGASFDAILGTFYPGTSLSEATGTVRVGVLDSPGDVALQFPNGGELRSPLEGEQTPGFPVRVAPGGSATVRYDGAYRVVGATIGAQSASPAVRWSAPASD